MKMEPRKRQNLIKRKFKISFWLATLFGVAVVPFIITACGAYTVIDARGSSSVQPFLAELSNRYSNKRNVEISVQAGGSSNGIQWIADGLTNMGNSSKSPADTVLKNPDLANRWKAQNLKTITLALDGIGLVYRQPEGYEPSDFAVSQSNINTLFTAFAGVEKVPLSTFYAGSNNNPPPNDIIIHPYARSGGSTTSGTAEAFLKDSGFKTKDLDKDVSRRLSSGDYGNNTTQTSESNAESYNHFKTNGKDAGSMVYLSLGFIENNLASIKTDGFSVLYYGEGKNAVNATVANVEKDKYKWYRPFNTIISLNASPKLAVIQDFMAWILFSKYLGNDDAAIVNDVYSSQGLIPLNEDIIIGMFLLPENSTKPELKELVQSHLDKFWVSDYGFFSGPKFGFVRVDS